MLPSRSAMEIVSSEEMRMIDRYAIRSMKIPSLHLMEQAGWEVAEALGRRFPDLHDRRILILCGKGNNGGDGFVAARRLHDSGHGACALLAADPRTLTGDARTSFASARQAGVEIVIAATPASWRAFRQRLGEFGLIVDALLGTGLSGPARGLVGRIIEDLRPSDGAAVSAHGTADDGFSAGRGRAPASDERVGRTYGPASAASVGRTRGPASAASVGRIGGLASAASAGRTHGAASAASAGTTRGSASAPAVPIVSVDIPSGLSGDAAGLSGPAIRADLTVALCRPKIAHVLPPACLSVGALEVADIGIPPEAVASVKPRMFTIEPEDFAGYPPPRARDAHKGTFGHVLVIAGSEGKAGAAALAARAALRAGAGLVTAATPSAVRPEVAVFTPEVMTLGIPPASPAATISTLVAESRQRSVAAAGPGLGREPEVAAWIRGFVKACPVPLVLDADGLNAFEGRAASLSGRRRTLVLTPHPGEMARLLGSRTRDVLADRIGAARSLAKKTRALVVLKGMATLVAAPDGRVFVNRTGNPGMATGGTGDVLTGILAGLLAQGLDPLRAVSFGVHVHGRAGDLAARAVGEHALIAGDLLDHLAAAIREFSS